MVYLSVRFTLYITLKLQKVLILNTELLIDREFSTKEHNSIYSILLSNLPFFIN